MNGLSRLGCACVLVSCGTLAGGAYGNDDASEYSIKMTRPMEAGQQFNVHAKGIQQYVVRDPAAANDDGDLTVMTVTLHGMATVFEVDKHGRPTALQYKVAECTMDRNGTTTTLAPKGSMLLARDDSGVTVWEIDGRPVSDDVSAALQMFGLVTGDHTVDDMLGTERARTVGESWAIDRESVAKAMKHELNHDVDASNVFGATTLVDAEDHAGMPCTVLYTQVSADNCAPPMAAMNGFKVRESAATATFEGVYPKNVNQPALSNSRSMSVKAMVFDASGAERELSWSRFVEFKMTAGTGHVATGAEVEVVND